MCENALPARAWPPSNLMRQRAAARYLNMPDSTFAKFGRAGFFPTVRFGGSPRSRLWYRREDLDAWMQSSTTPATAGPLAQREDGGAAQ